MIDLLTILTLLAAIPVGFALYGLCLRALRAHGQPDAPVVERRPPAAATVRRHERAAVPPTRSAA